MNSDIAKLKRELIDIGKRIAMEKLVVGPGGNISARMGDRIYIKASGSSFEDATEEDYIGVEIESGKTVDSDKRPSSEIWMHLECYKKREDVKAVIHTHPVYSIAYAFQDESLRFIPILYILLLMLFKMNL